MCNGAGFFLSGFFCFNSGRDGSSDGFVSCWMVPGNLPVFFLVGLVFAGLLYNGIPVWVFLLCAYYVDEYMARLTTVMTERH